MPSAISHDWFLFAVRSYYVAVPTIVRSPCDEAAILAGPSHTPGAGSGSWVLVAAILGSSMAFIDGTVVNVALPALQADLKASLADVQWVIEAYSLLLAALLLVGGSLGDHYGRRRIFMIGVAIFAVASTWCGLAGGIHQLIIARAVQGFGAALLVPGSLAIISSAFPEATNETTTTGCAKVKRGDSINAKTNAPRPIVVNAAPHQSSRPFALPMLSGTWQTAMTTTVIASGILMKKTARQET